MGLNEREIGNALDALALLVEPVETYFLWRPQVRDENDDMVLEAAVNGRATRSSLTMNGTSRPLRRLSVCPFATARNFREASTMRTPSNYALRLPASLKKAAEDAALEDGMTLNPFIVAAVAEKLGA